MHFLPRGGRRVRARSGRRIGTGERDAGVNPSQSMILELHWVQGEPQARTLADTHTRRARTCTHTRVHETTGNKVGGRG